MNSAIPTEDDRLPAEQPIDEIEIISGGQTGADRAALDFAIRHGIPHSGWCPRGRLAEDGRLDEIYQLTETSSAKYAERTLRNVLDSDATLVVSIAGEPTGGTALTLTLARQHAKPFLHLAREKTPSVTEAAGTLVEFLHEHQVRRLNVAGPRASQEPEIGPYVTEVLEAALTSICAHPIHLRTTQKRPSDVPDMRR